MIRVGWLVGLLLSIVGAASSAAHEGHDAVPEGNAVAIPSRQVLTALSERYEVVLKADPLRPGGKATLDLYLSDFQTNAPVSDVTISLSLRSRGREIWTGPASPTKRPGVFAVPFQAPPDTGRFTGMLTINGRKGVDRFALDGIEVRQEHSGADGASPRSIPWPWLLGIAAVVAVTLVAVARRRAGLSGAALVLLCAVAPVAPAHEGHDKTPTASGAPIGAGARVYVAKESQFLLGILTQALNPQPVQRRVSVMGRVAPRGGGDIEIVALQAGRIHFPNERTPILGQSVRKGESIAKLTVVDDLELRAPIGGVLTRVYVVNGQLVEAGQRIVALLDPSVLWVHADVYESDVASVQRSTRALITSQSVPDLALSGRRVAMGVTQGEVPGTVEAWFEVPNVDGRLRVGALVDVGIDLGEADMLFVVPRSAVFEKDGRKLLFVHTEPERFAAREITLGTSLGDRVVVAGDIHPGDRVVVAGGYPLLTAPVANLGN